MFKYVDIMVFSNTFSLGKISLPKERTIPTSKNKPKNFENTTKKKIYFLPVSACHKAAMQQQLRYGYKFYY